MKYSKNFSWAESVVQEELEIVFKALPVGFKNYVIEQKSQMINTDWENSKCEEA